MVQFGFEGMKSVNVELPGEKGGILYNVQFKVSPNYAFEMHIDTDDANAHMVKTGDIARIIK
jgi:putative phosphotransacetylase